MYPINQPLTSLPLTRPVPVYFTPFLNPNPKGKFSRQEWNEILPEFCYSASFDEVKEKGFTLVPSRYIEFVNRDENIDFDTKMKSLQGELKELLAQEEKSKSDLLAVFKELGYEIEL